MYNEYMCMPEHCNSMNVCIYVQKSDKLQHI